LAVGEIDVDALLARLTSRQLTEWMAFYRLEPFGERRADLRMAILAALIANVNRDPKKHREPFTVDDFMPKFEPIAEPQQSQSWQQQKAMLQSLFKPKS